MVASLKRGDEVITSGGIIGKIEKVYDDDKLFNNYLNSIKSYIKSISK